jgi:transcriptional regulator with XRE-family HTH domain
MKTKRYTMKNINVLDYMDSLEKEDKDLDLFVKMYEALSSFLTDFDFLKDSMGLTQKDVADKMGTTQSAISRIASMKTNPSYKQLQKMAEAVGGELLITPMKDMTVQVPYDLQNTVRELAKGENKTTNEYLDEVIRDSIQSEFKWYAKQTFEMNKVCERSTSYGSDLGNSKSNSSTSSIKFGKIQKNILMVYLPAMAVKNEVMYGRKI